MKAWPVFGALAGAALFLAACGGGGEPAGGAPASLTPVEAGTKPAETQTGEPSGPALPVETIDQGDDSGIVLEELQAWTIRSQREWDEFWSSHTSRMMPAPPLPEVDFERDMVIAVVDRQQSTGGYSLEVAGQAPGGEPLVAITRVVPGERCIVTQALTQPYHIVVTEGLTPDPRLALVERVRHCP